MQMLPRPKKFINCDTHNMIIAGICVQLNCNMTNALKNVKNAAVNKNSPAIIARYLPSRESPTHPTTGSNTITKGIIQSFCSLERLVESRSKDALNVNLVEELISIFHASKSSKARGNGWKHLVMIASSVVP